MIATKHCLDFDPKNDIPPLHGKIMLITGGTAGLGKQAVLELAHHSPGEIWLGARNLIKAKVVYGEIRQQIPGVSIKLLELDLASFASIRKAASTIIAECDRLDILMLNAGTMFVPLGLTQDGYEIQFGINHMGHALLTKLLLPVLETTAQLPGADVRVICLASHGHVFLNKGDFNFDTLKTGGEAIGPLQCYYQSKLANILWARQFAKRHPQLTVSAIDPGLVQTELAAKAEGISSSLRAQVEGMLLTPVEQGVKNQLWASVSMDVTSGEYYEPIGQGGLATDDGKDDQLAEKLWEWTEQELSCMKE